MLEAVDADVARVLARACLGAAEVAEDRRALVLSVATPQPAACGKEGVAAARVHEIAGLDAVTVAGVGAHLEPGIPRAELFALHRLVAFARARTAGAGMLEQHAVEVRTPHLIGVRRAVAESAAKREGVVAALVVRLEVCPALADTERTHLLEHAQPLEQRQVHRQQRLADMEARVMRLFHDDHAVAGSREQCRGGTACGAATDHRHITAFHAHRSASLRPCSASRQICVVRR